MLKYSISAITAAVVLFTACTSEPEFTGKFSYSPEGVMPGTEVTIMYNPDSTILAGRENIQCIAYLYNNKLINAIDVPLKRNGSILSGTINTSKETFGILFKFKSEDFLDNNDKNGYVIFLTDENGEEVTGSLSGYAAAINRWGAYYSDLGRDKDKALELFNKEFEAHPEIKNDFLGPYLEVIYAVRVDDREKLISAELNTLESKNDFTEEKLAILADWYSKINDELKANRYDKLIREKYPKSEYVQEKLYSEFRAEADINKKIELLDEFENNFPGSEYIESMYDLLANAYRDAKDYSAAVEFLQANMNKVSPFRFYAVVKQMLEENADMKTALEIARLGENRNRQEVKNPSVEKPKYFSESEWLADREYLLGINLFSYGKVLYNTDMKKESVPVLEEAVAFTKRKEGDINELYSKALVETGEYGKALEEIASFIQTGNSTERMKDYLKEAYINEKGTTEGFVTFSAQFEDAAREELIGRLERNLIIEPAPDFTLTGLDGKKVTLSKLRGKTVILDFWATWCGPCLASFPGMKKAVEKYHDNPNVKFLFINSWERVEEKKKHVKDFIAKNDYPFHVLLDEENKVIESFKVSGIPTKFVIDGNSNIRFVSVGYSGSEDQLVEELSLMISMVQ